MSKILIIAGMHRSGTSMITNWLHQCGLNIGETLLGPTEGNIDGHFEDDEFVRMHQEILIDNRYHLSGLTENFDTAAITPYQKEKLKAITVVKNRLYPQWGVKDPRLCLFFDVYSEIVPEAYYLFVLRDFQSVVSSLLKRTFYLDVERKYLARKAFQRMIWKNYRRERRLESFRNDITGHYLKVWINYNEQILKKITSMPVDKYLVVDYEALKIDDMPFFTYLTTKWDFNLKHVNFNSVYKEHLLNEAIDIEKYIKDKTLIVKAREIAEKLQSHIGFIA